MNAAARSPDELAWKPGVTAPTDADWAVRVLTEPTREADPLRPVSLHDRPDAVIILTWLTRLRWFAIAGQSSALLIGGAWLGLDLPLPWLLSVMGVTAATNLLLLGLLQRRWDLPGMLVPTILLLDVVLLTAMLAAVGGPQNPFCEFYLIHVAMAVVVLPARWTWAIAAVAILAYATLFMFHRPFQSDVPLRPETLSAGSWVALATTAGLIAYFIGRLRASLRARDRQLTRMRERLEHGERLASLATLAAGAAHELGSPLGTIAVVARELERTAPPSVPGTRTLEDVRLIRAEVDRCRRILDRMNVDNLRQGAETPTGLTPEALLAALKAELSHRPFEILTVTVDPRLRHFVAPVDALVQVLAILLQNALDACGSNGGGVELTMMPSAGGLRFEVADRGPGMTAEQMARLGDPFNTTKAPQHGMGLGLFLARSLAEHVRGRLEVASASGQGTRVVLEFPGSWS